jgi:sugar phosphate isomerase/epimerase
MTRREAVLALSAMLQQNMMRLPANRNVRWALGSNLWNSFPGSKFTDILDVMKDTGFIGVRLTQYPQILAKYGITPQSMERELSARGLHVITISFNGRADDSSRHPEILRSAQEAMQFLRRFGATELVVFSPRRNGQNAAPFAAMCDFYNKLGEVAGEMAFKAGLHNHLGQMVQTPEEINRCMELTNPRLFHLAPDTAHIYLAGGDPGAMLDRYKSRLMMADYKDAKRAGLATDFRPNIYDLGDGEIDFPACHKVLRSVHFSGWICVDLDIARAGPLVSYERCGRYIVQHLEPVYV